MKIESGAKSALDPNAVHSIRPYVHDDAPDLDLTVPNVTIVDAERTFWDKVVILHGLRRWFDIRGQLRGGGHRVSRHYYDIHMLMASDVGQKALANRALGADCVAHARMFFNRPDFDLASAIAPSFTLRPEGVMYDDLRRDYTAMSTMIFGAVPDFEAVIEFAEPIRKDRTGSGEKCEARKFRVTNCAGADCHAYFGQLQRGSPRPNDRR